jgi:ribonuclease HI
MIRSPQPSPDPTSIHAPGTHRHSNSHTGPDLTSLHINDSPQTNNTNVDKFLADQPPWIQHLLHTLTHDLPMDTIFDQLQHPTSTPVAVCDGSVQNDQGSFGWVIATSEPPRILIRCRGPAYGSNIDSFRAEAYGLLSVMTFLHLLATQHQQQLPPMTIWCDNISVVNTINKINQSRRPTFPNETLRPSWDILQAICRHFSRHSHLTLQHVRGHQDATTNFRDLPFPAKLNIEADKLATSFQQSSDHADVHGPAIPGTGCQLIVANKVITSHQRRKIRQQRGLERMVQYIAQRHHLTEETVTQIDWDSHMRAVNSFRQQHQTFLTKFLSKWLPVGKQTSRYDPTTYSSRCPSCDCPVEDFDHAFRCPARKGWQSTLRQALLKHLDRTDSDPILTDLLIEKLHHWFQETETPPTTRFDQYQQLVDSQTAIGWDQLIFGRWSQLWTHHQLEFLKRNNKPITNTNHGTGWASSIIQIIWSHCRDEWLCRNEALHGNDHKARKSARTTKAQFKIRSLYTLRSQCSPYVQSHWFYRSPEEHFARETSPINLENWITAHETRIITHIMYFREHRCQGQRNITDFLSHTVQDDMESNTPDSRSHSIVHNGNNLNAPLTSEPGGSADEELLAPR